MNESINDTKWIIFYYSSHSAEYVGKVSTMEVFGNSDIIETNNFKNKFPHYIFSSIQKG